MKVNITTLAVQITGMFVVIGVALFLAAGTVAWPAGWVFLVLFFAFTLALSAWLLGHNPGLLSERLTGLSNANQQAWDRVFYVLANVLFLAWLVLMPFDAVRFNWSRVPVWVQVLGLVLLLVSFYLFFLVFRENSYLSQAVRIQAEREHTVVSTGPYRYVRHPMYATAVLFLTGTTLLLGSWYGLLPALLIIVAVAIRSVQEERTLRAELPGYEAYMQRVKYRLIPYVW